MTKFEPTPGVVTVVLSDMELEMIRTNGYICSSTNDGTILMICKEGKRDEYE